MVVTRLAAIVAAAKCVLRVTIIGERAEESMQGLLELAKGVPQAGFVCCVGKHVLPLSCYRF